MKKLNQFIKLMLLFSLMSCEKIKFTDVRGFNGRVTLNVSDFGIPTHNINKPIGFELMQSLSFENIVNKNKIHTFKKEEIDFFNLGIHIADTTGTILKPDIDYKIIQTGFVFTGTNLYPQWAEDEKRYVARFKILFLIKGKFIVNADNHTLSIDRDNFLFRDKKLTVDFNVKSRQFEELKKYFPNLTEGQILLGRYPTYDKNPGLQGFFLIDVE